MPLYMQRLMFVQFLQSVISPRIHVAFFAHPPNLSLWVVVRVWPCRPFDGEAPATA